MCKRMKLEHSNIIHKNKLEVDWIKDLNVRPNTLKFLGENTGRTLWHKLQQNLKQRDQQWINLQNVQTMYKIQY